MASGLVFVEKWQTVDFESAFLKGLALPYEVSTFEEVCVVVLTLEGAIHGNQVDPTPLALRLIKRVPEGRGAASLVLPAKWVFIPPVRFHFVATYVVGVISTFPVAFEAVDVPFGLAV